MGKVTTAGLQRSLRHMVARSGKTYAQVSRELAKATRYVSVMLHDATTPRLDLMAKFANACGYKLLLVGHGEALEITGEYIDDGWSKTPVTVKRLWKVETAPIRVSSIADEMHFIPADIAGMNPESTPSGWLIDWQNVKEETEEEFERRDPEGYQQYIDDIYGLDDKWDESSWLEGPPYPPS